MEIIGLKCPCLSHELQQRSFLASGHFMMLFPNILSHPIISQIHLFVTSHFSTLCAWIQSAFRIFCGEDKGWGEGGG